MDSEDTEASTSVTASNIDKTEWTKEDKFHLYLGIKDHGSKSLNKIRCEYLPHKTIEDIKEAIGHYMLVARKSIDNTARKSKVRKKRPRPSIPLASWAKLLTDSMNFDDLQTEIPTALRLIGDLEHMPAPFLTEQIDFRQIYHQLADVMEGKSLPDKNRLISDVLGSCVLDTALVSKTFIKEYGSIISDVKISQKEVAILQKTFKDHQTNIVRDLLNQKNYNPLNINEDCLTYPSPETVAKKVSNALKLVSKVSFE